jgi:hypothetical protein
VFLAGDQARDLGRTPFDPPTMRRENSDPGTLARHDVHGVVDAFQVAPCELVVAAKVVGRSPFRHRYSLQPIVALLAHILQMGGAADHRSRTLFHISRSHQLVGLTASLAEGLI